MEFRKIRKILLGADWRYASEREEGAYVYMLMELKPEDAKPAIEAAREKVKKTLGSSVKIKPLAPDRLEDLVHVFNRSMLTAPDPYQPIAIEEARRLPMESTFIAYLGSKPVGFIICTLEGKTGVIAGIGVDPAYQRRGIATALALAATEYLARKGVERVVCEVYEGNKPSLSFIRGFGFREAGRRYVLKAPRAGS